MNLDFLNSLDFSYFTAPAFRTKLLVVLLYLVVGSLLIRLLVFVFRRTAYKRMTEQSYMLVRKGIIYFGYAVLFIMVLTELGVNFTALLGAAGIIGVAMGIASRNSLGNIISGLFLLGEKSFAIGDVVRIEEVTGVVHSIDLLSIKLRTFDNTFVRIPHEKIINTNLINITHFPIRRMDLKFRVAFDEDLEKVRQTCLAVAEQNQFALNDPELFFITDGFDDFGVKVTFGLWFYKTDFVALKNSIMIQLQKAFAHEKIAITKPQIYEKT